MLQSLLRCGSVTACRFKKLHSFLQLLCVPNTGFDNDDGVNVAKNDDDDDDDANDEDADDVDDDVDADDDDDDEDDEKVGKFKCV